MVLNSSNKKPSFQTKPYRGGHNLSHPLYPNSVHSFSGSRPITRPCFRHPTPWNSIKSYCQICHKQGHTANTCWHRYDPSTNYSFTANVSQSSFSIGDDSTPSILGAPSTIKDPLSYPDSEATDHVTNDPSVFHNKSLYHGSESLKVGNGQGMSIIHTGSAFYIAPHTHKVPST